MNKFFVKFIILSSLLFISQLAAYYLVPHENPQPQEVSLFKSYLNKNTEIIYFGDSSATSYSYQDRNKGSIQTFLADNLKEYQIGAITHPAYMMDTFEKYIKYLTKNNQAVKIIVITVNLRSFSKEIEENPMNQFRKVKFFLEYPSSLLNILYQPMSAFKVYQVGSDSKLNGSKSDTMEQQLKLRYMYDLSKNQTGIKTMEQIKDHLGGSNIKVLFYITPIDYQEASRFMGREFEIKVSQNISVLKEILDKPNIEVLDLSFSLDHQSFDWPGIYMNEHLKEDGRKFVARQLANFIRNKFN